MPERSEVVLSVRIANELVARAPLSPSLYTMVLLVRNLVLEPDPEYATGRVLDTFWSVWVDSLDMPGTGIGDEGLCFLNRRLESPMRLELATRQVLPPWEVPAGLGDEGASEVSAMSTRTGDGSLLLEITDALGNKRRLEFHEPSVNNVCVIWAPGELEGIGTVKHSEGDLFMPSVPFRLGVGSAMRIETRRRKPRAQSRA